MTLLCAVACGVDRRLRIETEPRGAEVIVDGRVLGTSPLELHFTHYGPRLVRAELLEASGGKTLVAQQHIDLVPPWYGSFPFDIFSELVLPLWRTDYHRVVLILEPGGSQPATRAAAAEDPAARDEAAIRRARDLQLWTPGEPIPVIPASRPAPASKP